MVCLYLRRGLSFLAADSKKRTNEGGRSSNANSPVLRTMDIPLTSPEEFSESPYRVVRKRADAVAPQHGPKGKGSVTRGANASRLTRNGVSIGVSAGVGMNGQARRT